MTLHDVSCQLYDLSLDGFFNHEKFSKQRLYNMLTAHMREAQCNTLHNAFLMEIALQDGWWYFTVNKHISGREVEYSYFIPQTR